MTQSSKCPNCCQICGKNHNGPADLLDNIQWRIEKADGYHSSACADSCLPVYDLHLLKELRNYIIKHKYERNK